MMKELLSAIFLKKPSAVDSSVPVFRITETGPVKSDFEVTELSYEEYVKFNSQERRHASHTVSYDRRNPTGASHA